MLIGIVPPSDSLPVQPILNPGKNHFIKANEKAYLIVSEDFSVVNMPYEKFNFLYD